VSLTLFPNGVGQKLAVGVGTTAGDITVTGDIKAEDTIVQVLKLTMTSAVVGEPSVLSSAEDLTGEFTVADDDTINNTGGTDTTGATLVVIYAQAER